MRPRRVSEFSDLEAIRRYLIRGLNEALRQERRGVVEDFSRERFDAGLRASPASAAGRWAAKRAGWRS